MSEKIEILEIDVIQERDLYATGQYTRTSLWLDPQKRKLRVQQVMRTNSTTFALWHGRELEELLTPPEHEAEAPDADALKEYLESDEAQTLLDQVCSGHSVDWDGNNMVGSLTEDALGAWETLLREIDDLPRSEWHTWEVEEWLRCSSLSDLQLSITATDEEIEAAAAQIEADAKADKVKILGDVTEYLKEKISIAKEEAEADQE